MANILSQANSSTTILSSGVQNGPDRTCTASAASTRTSGMSATCRTHGRQLRPYAFLLEHDLDLSDTQKKLEVNMMLGVPYTPAMADSAVADAKRQAAEIAAQVEKDGGPTGLADKEIMALVAYLQRLGTDIKKEAK
jgi:hypothetical protein